MKNTKRNKMRELLMELEEKGKINYDISYRGGQYGITQDNYFEYVDRRARKYANLLPWKIGAFCNYLGGGLRGLIGRSNYLGSLPKGIANRIDQFTRACQKRYEEIEIEMGLQDEADLEWEGTKMAREDGIISVY